MKTESPILCYPMLINASCIASKSTGRSDGDSLNAILGLNSEFAKVCVNFDFVWRAIHKLRAQVQLSPQ